MTKRLDGTAVDSDGKAKNFFWPFDMVPTLKPLVPTPDSIGRGVRLGAADGRQSHSSKRCMQSMDWRVVRTTIEHVVSARFLIFDHF